MPKVIHYDTLETFEEVDGLYYPSSKLTARKMVSLPARPACI
jgi:hypothetical protein